MDVCNSQLEFYLRPARKFWTFLTDFSDVKTSVWALTETLMTMLINQHDVDDDDNHNNNNNSNDNDYINHYRNHIYNDSDHDNDDNDENDIQHHNYNAFSDID